MMALALAALLGAVGCKHEPLVPHVDDTLPDTTLGCAPGTVYFVNDVLPIFNSSCAMSGCHSAASAQDGVVLDSYASIMNTGKVKAGDPGDSEVYDVITDSDPDKLMPPPSSGITLTPQQINTIYVWIAQGAKNNVCVESTPCDTLGVSFASDIQPILSNYCLGCHSGSFPSGGIGLSSHQQVLLQVNNGKLLGSVSHTPGFSAMPQGQAKLDACKVALIGNWIAQGAADN
jgi:hypothetical protein